MPCHRTPSPTCQAKSWTQPLWIIASSRCNSSSSNIRSLTLMLACDILLEHLVHGFELVCRDGTRFNVTAWVAIHHQTICLTYGFGLGQWVVTQAATTQSALAANVININKEYSNTKHWWSKSYNNRAFSSIKQQRSLQLEQQPQQQCWSMSG